MTAESRTGAATHCPYCGQPIGSDQREHIREAEVKHLKDSKDEFEEELNRKLAEKESSVKAAMAQQVTDRVAEAKLSVEKDLQKDIHEKERKLELANKTIETLGRQLDAKPAYELGGIQEDELVDLLNSEFPRDRIHLVSSRAGPDVEHEVLHEGESCGIIIYESKNVQAWQSGFLAKLNRDKLESGAAYAVLVSTAFPAKAHDFCVEEGIAVVHPRLVVHLIRIVRQALVDVKLQALSKKETGFKLEQLMIYLNGPDFRNKMQSVFSAVDKLEGLQQKEKRAHDKSWKEENTLYRIIRVGSSDVQSEIEAILAGK